MATDYRLGDYRVVADRLRPASAHLLDWCSPAPGDLVVDLGAGSGNLARLAAQRGARPVAVDRVREQLLLGAADGSDGIAWVTGDAHALPLRDAVAAATLSVFALIYADDPVQAVREAARVTRPGGTLGLAAWPGGDFQLELVSAIRDATGVRPDHDPLVVWGTPDAIGQQLAAVADDVETTTGALVDRHDSVDAWWRAREQSPLIAGAQARLSADDYEALGRRLREIADRYGERPDDQADGLVLRDEYLLARARVR